MNTATDLWQTSTHVRMTFIEPLCRQTSPGDYKSIHDERALSEFSFMSEEKRGRRRGRVCLKSKTNINSLFIYSIKLLIISACYSAEEAAELQKDALTGFKVNFAVVWCVGSCSTW